MEIGIIRVSIELGTYIALEDKFALNKKIESCINSSINDASTKSSVAYLYIYEMLTRDINSPEIKGPSFVKEDNCIEYGLRIPFEKIIENSTRKGIGHSYVDELFAGLDLVFRDFEIDLKILFNAKECVINSLK